MSNILKKFYSNDSKRFWETDRSLDGRDRDVYNLLSEKSGVVLEYGCGCGSLLYNICLQDRFSQCYGFDLSEELISKIQSAWSSNNPNKTSKMKVAIPENDTMPDIADKTIDVVICVATLEHVVNPYIILDELFRVSKNDAVFVCSVPNYAYVKHRVEIMLGKQPKTGTDCPVEQWREVGWDGMHVHTFTKSSFSILLADCGWKPIIWRGSGTRFNSLGLWLLRKHFPGFWSGELMVMCSKNQQ